MQSVLILAAAGALLTLDFKSTWLRLEIHATEQVVEGKFAFAERTCTELAPGTAFVLLKEQPCQGIASTAKTRVFLIAAAAISGSRSTLRYENILRSAINATELQWEITVPSHLDLEMTVLGLEIETEDQYFPTSLSSPCPLSCFLASRRLDSNNSYNSDYCDSSQPNSTCKSTPLPTWVSVMLTLALCLG